MGLKKLLGIFVVIGLSLGITNQVTSFTTSDIKSKAGIMITSSERALIGVPEFINAGVIIQGSLKNINIRISNNMTNKIELVNIEAVDSKVNIMLQGTISIFPGDTVVVPMVVTADSAAEVGEGIVDLVCSFEWEEGSAVIEDNMFINIQKPIEIKSNIQRVIVNKNTIVEAEIVNESGIKHKILNIQFPLDKYITTDLSQVLIRDNKIILPITITSIEPNLYEIPAVFTIDNEGCITTVETVIFLNIESGEKEIEVFTKESTSETHTDTNNVDKNEGLEEVDDNE